MKLQVTKNLKNSVYSSKFELTEMTEFDTELLEDYEGTTFLQVGFDITETVTEEVDGVPTEKTTVLLAQPDKFIAFASAFPYERAFSISQYGVLAEKLAENYTTQLTAKVVKLVEELKTKGDSFTGVEEVLLTP